MMTGRILAASPRSASYISPGWVFIEQVEDLLFGGARARDIEDVVIGEFDNLSDALPGLCRCLGFPLAQSSVQLLCQGVHGAPALVLSVTASALDDTCQVPDREGSDAPVH